MIVFPSRKAPPVMLGGGGGGGEYSAEAQQFFDRISDPGTARKDLYAAAIDAFVSAGVWAKLDALYVFAAAISATALTNLKQDAFNATAVNSPTFTEDRGFQGDGSSAYINSNFNPSTASSPNFTQNSGCVFGWSLTNAAADKNLFGVVSVPPRCTVRPRTTSNTSLWAINNTTDGSVANSDSSGLFCVNRSASNAAQLYRNGASLSSNTTSSSGLPNADFVALRNTTGYNGDHRIAVYGFGASLDADEQAALHAAPLAYLQGVGAV